MFLVNITMAAPALNQQSTPTKSGACTKLEEDAILQISDTEMPVLTQLQATELCAPDKAEYMSNNERGFIRKNDKTSRCVTGYYTKYLSRKAISD